MDQAKLLDVLTSLPLSHSILPRTVCFVTSRPANHAICSYIDSSGYASGPIRRYLALMDGLKDATKGVWQESGPANINNVLEWPLCGLTGTGDIMKQQDYFGMRYREIFSFFLPKISLKLLEWEKNLVTKCSLAKDSARRSHQKFMM